MLVIACRTSSAVTLDSPVTSVGVSSAQNNAACISLVRFLRSDHNLDGNWRSWLGIEAHPGRHFRHLLLVLYILGRIKEDVMVEKDQILSTHNSSNRECSCS